MDSIIVRLTGGLGNQIFQYAAGASLARRLGLPLLLDDYWYRSGGDRVFLLRHFALDAPLADEAAVHAVAGYRRSLRQKLAHGLSALWPGNERDEAPSGAILKEPGEGLSEEFFRWRGKAYLDGYWQSTRYLAGHEEALRRDLRLREKPRGRNAEQLERLATVEAVSLHVRRGDYAADPRLRAIHGLCGTDYYRRALALVEARHGRLPCLVFSDDPDGARRDLDLPETAVTVDWNGDEAPHEDLRLMAACRHHVLANSSFSWWGAWLARREGQSVVAPSPWFRSAYRIREGFFPEDWTVLPVDADEGEGQA